MARGQRWRCLAIGSMALVALSLGGVRAFAEVDRAKTPVEVDRAKTPVSDGADPLFDDEIDDFEVGPPPPSDPLEGMNRQTQRINEEIDTWVLDPVTWTYRKITPRLLRDSMRHFFWNLGEPTTLVNDLLQREWDDAAVTLTRLVVNSTLGLAGLFDPATSLGLEAHESDFGQTMALAGVGAGPYLVLPVVGPSTVRDGVGLAVDVAFRPSTYVVPLADQLVFTTIQGGGSGLTLREEHYDELKLLKASSIDYYSALRSAYTQNRDAEIWARRENHRTANGAEETDTRTCEAAPADGDENGDHGATSPRPCSPPQAPPTSDSLPSPEHRSPRVEAPSHTRIVAGRPR